MKIKQKTAFVIIGVILVLALMLGTIGYLITHTNIKAGQVGYVYDRTLSPESPNVIPGTSVVNQPRTGRIFVNPFTQEILVYPTTIVMKSWTRPSEGDNKGVDWSVTTSSVEGNEVLADIYISVKPKNIGQIIASFGMKKFDIILDNDIYGLARGKLSSVVQLYSVYDVQSKKSVIQSEVYKLLKEDLEKIYGVELVQYEIGTLTPPADIQAKISQKTEAINAVALAQLDTQRQAEVNKRTLDEQRMASEKEFLARKNTADAAAYEKESGARSTLESAKLATQTKKEEVEQARLTKEAELERQEYFTDAYFKNKSLDVQREALSKLNGSLRTIVTDTKLTGIDNIFGISEIMKVVSDEPAAQQ